MEQLDLGFNYRITDMQAALGISQMKRLDEFIDRRQQLVDRYNLKLKGPAVKNCIFKTQLPSHPIICTLCALIQMKLKKNSQAII